MRRVPPSRQYGVTLLPFPLVALKTQCSLFLDGQYTNSHSGHSPASHSSRLGSSQLLPAAVRMQRFNFSGLPFFLSSPSGSGTYRGKGRLLEVFCSAMPPAMAPQIQVLDPLPDVECKGLPLPSPTTLWSEDCVLCVEAHGLLLSPGPFCPLSAHSLLTSRAMRPGGGSGRGGRGRGRRDRSSGIRSGGRRPRTTSSGRGKGSGSGKGMARASGRLGPMTAGPAGAPPAPTATAALASSSPAAAATTASSFSFRPKPRPRPRSRGAAGSSCGQGEGVRDG